MKSYLIQFVPSGGYRSDTNGNPIKYHSDFDAMVATTAWARESNMPIDKFLIVEEKTNEK